MSSNVDTHLLADQYGLTSPEFNTLFKPSKCWATPNGRFGPNGLQKRLHETFPRYNIPLSLCDKICSAAGSQCPDGAFGISRREFSTFLDILQQPDSPDDAYVDSKTLLLAGLSPES